VTLRRSVVEVARMDCGAEEQLVRAALEGHPAVVRLAFDLPARALTAWHHGDPAAAAAGGSEARTLWIVLAINAAMFVVELAAGWLAQSTGLLADGLDMLADALVYALALLAVGRPPAAKRRAARLCGWLQLALGAGALAEVARRALFGSAPEPPAMIGVSLLALVANVASLLLVARHREGGAHMKASYICTANDVLANAGVIAAGALVAWTGSRLPDLLIGATIAGVVLQGARRILRLP
jgi:Co/Zn/Cd efflux system component